MTEEKKANNKVTMIMLVLVFTVPFLLAVLALKGDWFNKAATNKGELLTPAIELPDLLRGETPVWRILYVLPETCEQKCQNALYSLNQIWEASGREKERVIPTILKTEKSDIAALAEVNTANQFKVVQSDKDTLIASFQGTNPEWLFISDTLGNVILRYPLSAEKQEAIMKSRDVLADLRKLLKLSRIG